MAALPDVNNNPGDLKDPTTGQFRQFASPQEGYAALANDLQQKIDGKSTTGLNGSSTLYDFSKAWAPKSDKNDPASYAANLANTLGVRPDTPIGELKSRVGDFAQAIARNEGYSKAKNFVATASPAQTTQPTATLATASTTSTTPQTGGMGSTLAKVGNFLFPAVKDVYNDFTGQNTGADHKTGLQQLGDVGLTALPFIPGLGEAGEGARAAEVAGEGAEALKGGDVADTILSKIKGSPAAKGAISGYGAGVASNLSQGKSVGSSLAPNLNTLSGALLGGATPGIIDAIGGARKAVSGLTPQMEEALRHTDPAEYDRYINAVKNRNGNIRAPSAEAMAADQLDKADQKIGQNLSQAQSAVGVAKSKLGSTPIPDLTPVANDFIDRVKNRFGLQLATDDKGIVHAIPLPNRTPSIGASEISRIETAAQDLDHLQGSTAQHATDVIAKIDNDLDYKKAAGGIHPFDPIEKLLHSMRSGIDDSVRSVAPDLASANDRATQLHRLQDEVTKMAGGQNQRGELLMKRVFSGDKSGEVQDLFNKIKSETGIDLVNHAVLAKHAINSVGDASQRSLLQQAIEGGLKPEGGIFQTLKGLAGTVARKTLANPESLGRKATEEPSGILKSLLTKAGVESTRALSSASNSK